MLTFVSNKEPLSVSVKVCLVLCCECRYFSCVEFTATQCKNGTWEITITDAAVLAFIGTSSATLYPVVLSEQDLDSATEYEYTP